MQLLSIGGGDKISQQYFSNNTLSTQALRYTDRIPKSYQNRYAHISPDAPNHVRNPKSVVGSKNPGLDMYPKSTSS